MFHQLQMIFATIASPVVRRPRPRRQALLARPGIEPLEDRWVPATHVWIGPHAGGLWNNAGNWTNGQPTSGEAGGTVLQFNEENSSTDNIPGLVIDQLHFTGGGNVLRRRSASRWASVGPISRLTSSTIWGLTRWITLCRSTWWAPTVTGSWRAAD